MRARNKQNEFIYYNEEESKGDSISSLNQVFTRKREDSPHSLISVCFVTS